MIFLWFSAVWLLYIWVCISLSFSWLRFTEPLMSYLCLFTNLGRFPLFIFFYITLSWTSGTQVTPNSDLVLLSHRYLRCYLSFFFQFFSLLCRLDNYSSSVFKFDDAIVLQLSPSSKYFYFVFVFVSCKTSSSKMIILKISLISLQRLSFHLFQDRTVCP